MTEYEIVCTNQEPAGQPATHAHIVSVGIGGTPKAPGQILRLADVLYNLDIGNKFYTVSPSTGRKAYVVAVKCDRCYAGSRIIRSAPDAVRDNNLDNLAFCPIR